MYVCLYLGFNLELVFNSSTNHGGRFSSSYNANKREILSLVATESSWLICCLNRYWFWWSWKKTKTLKTHYKSIASHKQFKEISRDDSAAFKVIISIFPSRARLCFRPQARRSTFNKLSVYKQSALVDKIYITIAKSLVLSQ